MCENNTYTEISPPEPKRFEILKSDNIFAIIFFISSFLISALGFFGGFRGGFTVSAIVLTTVTTIYLRNKNSKIKPYPLFCLILSIAVSIGFLTTSNAAVRFWSFVIYWLLSLVWFTSLCRSEGERSDLSILRFIFLPIAYSIPNVGVALISLLSGDKNRNKALGKSLLGIIISVPFVLVIVPLLMSSDEAFSGMVSLAFSGIFNTVLKLALAIIIFIFILSYVFTLKKDTEPEIKESSFNGIEATALISFLSVLGFCYLSYLFSQLAYFFSAFSGFLPEGYKFTLSAYARRGFFEMTVIAAINFAVIFAVLLLSKKKNKRMCLTLNILCTFIGAFTLIIIATALSKMFLYISSYGMTILRITTSAFMIFLTVVFVALLIRLFSPKIKVIKTALITAAVILTVLGTVNVNSFVAFYNYNAYKTGYLKEIDVATISELGEEGIPYLIKLTEDEDYDVSSIATLKLSDAYKDYYELDLDEFDNTVLGKKKHTVISRFSISRSKAYRNLESFYKENTYILNYRNVYYESNNAEVYPDEYYEW